MAKLGNIVIYPQDTGELQPMGVHFKGDVIQSHRRKPAKTAKINKTPQRNHYYWERPLFYKWQVRRMQ